MAGISTESMPDQTPQPGTPNQPLVFRHYRRHRKHSRCGTFSLWAPLPMALWFMYWFLMINQRDVSTDASGRGMEWWMLYIGCGVFSLVGVILAVVGLMDSYHRRGRATLGLVINLIILIILGTLFGVRAFAKSFG